MTTQTTIDEFLDLACLTYSPEDSPGRIADAASMLERDPDIANANIWTAATTGSPTSISALLRVDSTAARELGGPRNWPPLLYLCYSRLPEIEPSRDFIAATRVLLEHGADPNSFFLWDGTYRFTALTGAIGEGERGIKNQPPHARAYELATLLLEAGADPNDAQGLYNSMFRANDQWLKLLLDYGLSPKHVINWNTDKGTKTLDFLLGHAVTAGYADRVALLLQHGADPDALDYYNGRPPITNALLNGFADIAGLLEQYGAEREQLTLEESFRSACMSADTVAAHTLSTEHPTLLRDPSLLSDAAGNGLVDAAGLLIELGADVNALDQGGASPLHRAAWRGDMDMARLLVAQGAKSQPDRQHNATPTGWADYAGNHALRDFLLEHTADIFDLVALGSPEMVERTLAMSPDLVHARDASGNTSAHCVTTRNADALDVLKILAKHGADLNATNTSGMTVMEIARQSGSSEIVDLLGQLGAK